MSGYLPEHKIEEIRTAADIVQVVQACVPLTQAGRLYKGLCPFHAEKTPSFTVNPERRIFHCFGCGAGGDVFGFIMKHKGLTFPEAVAELAERLGVDLPRTASGPGPGERSQRSALYSAVGLALKFFEEELDASGGRPAREYLAQRGLSPEIILEYHLGWAPNSWDQLRLYLESRQVPREIMAQAGLVRSTADGRRYYDVFRGRVITPIFDRDGRPVAFGGRIIETLEGQPKYLNSPETPIFGKGRLLYGLHGHRPALQARGLALLVEGYFDLLALAQHGLRHVVATLGTALTTHHLRLLKGLVQRVVLLFDADEAGRSAAARALPLVMSADLDGLVLTLPEGHDPDTFVREHGPAALEAAATQARPLLDYYLERTLSRHPDTPAGKSRAAQEVLGVIAQIEGLTRQSLVRRALADRLGVSEAALSRDERRPVAPATLEGDDEDQTSRLVTDYQTEALRLVLLHSQAAGPLLSAGLETSFKDQVCRRLYEAMGRQFEETGRVDAERLCQLGPEESDLVTALAMSQDGLDPAGVNAAVADFLARFPERTERDRSRELSRRIKAAQAAGDAAGVAALLREKAEQLKQMTKIVPRRSL